MTGAALQLRVVEVDPSADPRWDAYVEAHPDAVVYQHSAWLRALQREYPRPAVNLAVSDPAGGLHGVMPLTITRGLPFGRGGELAGRRLASLPRTPLAGPLADDGAGLELLVGAARRRLPDGARLQLKPADERLGALVPPLIDQPWRCNYVVDLPDDPAALRFGRRSNHVSIRSSIKTATADGVAVRRAEDLADVREWYRLYLQTMRHHVVPARPLRLFTALWAELRPRGMMRLLLAERGGELLAGSVLLMLGPTVFYAFNGSRRSALRFRANDVLQWQAIHDACAEGYRHYDLGEVADGHDGLAHFKRKWGAQTRQLHRYSYPARSEPASGGAGGVGGADGAAEGWSGRVWRRLPLAVTAAAGRLAYRYL